LKNHRRLNKGTNKLHGLSLPLAKLTFFMVITKSIAYLTSKSEKKENVLVNMVLAIGKQPMENKYILISR
jgi:hypothetical protein